MIRYDFTRRAERMFLKLPQDTRIQIIRKLEHYLAQPDPFVFARPLEGALYMIGTIDEAKGK